MKFFNVLMVPILAAILLISCGDGARNKSAEKMKEVMALHDEVMPQMSKVSKLVSELKPLADSSETNSVYRDAIVDLQKAHTDMMDWMKNFGSHFTSDQILKGVALSEDKMKQLLEDEKKMQEIKRQMEKSIKQAQELLAQ